jgi:outer membrane protein TolC
LFDGLARENKVREAASSLAAQKANEDQIRNDISLQVRDAFLNLRTALQTVGQTKKAVDSATEGYKVTSSRYLSGVGTNVEVLDSQVDLAQAKANYVKSIFDVELAKAKINQVVGKVVL